MVMVWLHLKAKILVIKINEGVIEKGGGGSRAVLLN